MGAHCVHYTSHYVEIRGRVRPGKYRVIQIPSERVIIRTFPARTITTYDRRLRPASNMCRNKRVSRNARKVLTRSSLSHSRDHSIAIDLRLRQYNRGRYPDIGESTRKHAEVVTDPLTNIICMNNLVTEHTNSFETNNIQFTIIGTC